MDDMTRRNAIKLTAAAGTAAVLGTAMGADRKKSVGKHEEDIWRAWATTEGKETKLVIEGIYNQGGPGLVALLKPATPQGTNPKILLMELTLATLPGTWPSVLIPIPARYVQTPYKKEQYESVHVLYPDGHGEIIKEITDAGKGPKTTPKDSK